MSDIELVIQAKAADLGDNFVVRRSLPNRNKRMVGPFIFWDHMGPVALKGDKGMTVRAHPHIGLATITWLFSGEIMHRDSLGNEQPIRPGEVNWMTAGKGIVHSERSYPKDGPVTLEGIQLWLALPREHEQIDPSFFHCKEKDLASIEEKGTRLTIIAGEALGLTSPVPVYSDLFYLNGDSQKDSHFEMPLKKNHEGVVYVAGGKIVVEGQEYEQFSLIIFKQGTKISYKALTDSKIMILGGEIFPEKRYIWWNFVSTDQAKIEKAKQDWQEGKFPKVVNEEEWIPLPE